MMGHPKPVKGTARRERRTRVRKRRTKEVDAKQKVRLRDGYCRFPLCGCGRYGLALHVSHQQHKGMGGNPAGDRSTTAGMVYVCAQRHREGIVSIDRGTLRWTALTPMGADGPITWDVLNGFGRPASLGPLPAGYPRWVELARERSIHVYEPLTEGQERLLREFARMQF